MKKRFKWALYFGVRSAIGCHENISVPCFDRSSSFVSLTNTFSSYKTWKTIRREINDSYSKNPKFIYVSFWLIHTEKTPALTQRQRQDLLSSVGEKAVTPLSKWLCKNKTPRLARPNKEIHILCFLTTLQNAVQTKALCLKLKCNWQKLCI